MIYFFVFLTQLLVWSFFAIVISVYALVIIPNNPPVDECAGRVASSNDDLDNATHKLSVIYQSIVIFFTFLFGALFWYSSYSLFEVTKEGTDDSLCFLFFVFLFFLFFCFCFLFQFKDCLVKT
jgi:hypothetical protein